MLDKYLEELKKIMNYSRGVYHICDDRFSHALEIIVDDLSELIDEIEERNGNEKGSVSDLGPINSDDINININDEKLSDIFHVRIVNALKVFDIKTLNEMLDYSATQLLKVPNLGRVSLGIVESYLKEKNLKFRGVKNV